ncbi:hypothetical protein MAUB1S_11896 [Mycolicibacterium aubagnense]
MSGPSSPTELNVCDRCKPLRTRQPSSSRNSSRPAASTRSGCGTGSYGRKHHRPPTTPRIGRPLRREHRPSATRLLSPNGIALPFHLIALLEAQARTKPGMKPGPSPLPLKGLGSKKPGWTHLVATSAESSGSGRSRSSVVDKKLRQIHSALKRLRYENLIDCPNAAAPRGKFEGFLLTMEDERRRRTNDLYRVPEHDGSYFTVPLTLFTNGWIYVLEDTELVLLLITMRSRYLHGDEELTFSGGVRTVHYGVGPDAFEAHRVLEYLGLIDVISDYRRQSDGRVYKYQEQGAAPHKLVFQPDALENSAFPTFLTEIENQLAKPEPDVEPAI